VFEIFMPSESSVSDGIILFYTHSKKVSWQGGEAEAAHTYEKASLRSKLIF